MKPRDKEVEAEVIKALGSPDAATRQSACQVLRVIGTAASIPALRRATGDERRNVATAARAALTAIDSAANPEAPAEKPKSTKGTTPRKKN
jgi:HEAT repeat protein